MKPYLTFAADCMAVFIFTIFSNSLLSQQLQPEYNISADSTLLTNFVTKATLHPDQADSLIQLSIDLVNTIDHPQLWKVHYYNLAKYFYTVGKQDLVSEHVQKGLNLDYPKPDVHLPKFYNLLGAVELTNNKTKKAVDWFVKALDAYEKLGDKKNAAYVQSNLGNMFLSMKNYEEAKVYFYDSYNALKTYGDTILLPTATALMSFVHCTLGESQDAEKYADEAIALSNQYNNFQSLAVATSAKGEIELERGNYQEAIVQLMIASEKVKLAPRPQLELAISAGLLRAYNGVEDFENAIVQGEQAISFAQKMETNDIMYTLNKNLAIAYAGIGRHQEAFALMKSAEETQSEKLSKENQEVVHDLLIKYESEKKDNTILRQKSDLTNRRIWIFGLGALVALLLISLFILSKYSKQKQRTIIVESERKVLQSINEGEQMERSRMANELHDGVASSLVAIKMKIENMTNHSNKASLVSMIQDVHKEVRLISHNLSPIDFNKKTLSSCLEQFSKNCNSDKCTVDFYSNAEETKMPTKKANILYRNTQEIIQNALKHSKAKEINVQYLFSNNQLKISVEDDGVGFNANEMKNSSKAIAINSRLSNIDAKIEYDSSPSGSSVFLEVENVLN